MDKTKKVFLAKSVAYYSLGVVVMTFGITMPVRADIGVAPGGLIPFAVSQLTPLTIGQCAAMFHIFCMLLQLAITRKPTIKLLLQFPMAFVVGFMMDVFYAWLDIGEQSMLFRVMFLIAGMFVFSLGIRIIVGANVLISPADGLAQSIGNAFGWPMSKAKLVFDIVVTAFTALLTLALARDPLIAVGIGTAICTVGTGPIIGLYTKLFPFFDMD